jgi:hypothetical protein
VEDKNIKSRPCAARASISLLTLALVLSSLLATGSAAAAEEDRRWSLTLYGGTLVNADLGEIITEFPPETEDSQFFALTLAREFAASGPHLRWEVEGQVVKHFGTQDHWELNPVLVLRWITFPWDRWADTSAAFGIGVSYATEVPEIEARRHPNTGSARLLSYLMMELSVGIPGAPEWSLVARVHHRSGAWGLFSDVHGASNALALGIKYRF